MRQARTAAVGVTALNRICADQRISIPRHDTSRLHDCIVDLFRPYPSWIVACKQRYVVNLPFAGYLELSWYADDWTIVLINSRRFVSRSMKNLPSF